MKKSGLRQPESAERSRGEGGTSTRNARPPRLHVREVAHEENPCDAKPLQCPAQSEVWAKVWAKARGGRPPDVPPGSWQRFVSANIGTRQG